MLYCDNEYCDSQATKVVAISVRKYGDQTCCYCAPCENAYSAGKQHAAYRAAFRCAEALAEALELPLIEDITPRLVMFSDSDEVIKMVEREVQRIRNVVPD